MSTNTIIQRVVSSLRAHGNHSEAEELLSFLSELRTQTECLLDAHKKGQELIKHYINAVQSRCPHYEWHLTQTEPVVACENCGHSVSNARAWTFGKRVLQGDYSMYAKRGRCFGLNPFLKQALAAQLKVTQCVKVEKADVNQETLRDHGQDHAGSEA